MAAAVAGAPTTTLEALTPLLGLRPEPDAERATDAPPAPIGTDGARARLGVIAGRSGPRFGVPLDHPDATPEACLAYLGLRDARTQLTRGAVGYALKARLSRLVVGEVLSMDAGPGSLLARLDELLADPDEEPGLAVAVGFGGFDEVWKPTLQVFRPDGTPAAFVKIGLGPVGDRLVATEAETLARWQQAPDPRLLVPGLIAETTWQDLRLAVVAPLPDDARRLPGPAPSAWAVRTLDGPEQTATLHDAAWWTGRRAANEAHPEVDELLDRIAQRDGGTEHRWGRWHGDWVPWNLARCHRGLVAWDWEYSEPGAPVGLDEVHGAYQQARVVDGRTIAEALATARAAAAQVAASHPAPVDARDVAARAGAEPTAPLGSADLLADAHVAMLVTRSAELERLLGHPPADRAELFAAARDVVRRPS